MKKMPLLFIPPEMHKENAGAFSFMLFGFLQPIQPYLESGLIPLHGIAVPALPQSIRAPGRRIERRVLPEIIDMIGQHIAVLLPQCVIHDIQPDILTTRQPRPLSRDVVLASGTEEVRDLSGAALQ